MKPGRLHRKTQESRLRGMPSAALEPLLRKSNSRPTLHDVARVAGVGTTTVSRVINGGHLVAPEMLALVKKVMNDLGYEPNQAARSLKSARTRTIGLIIPSIADPFFSEFASVAEQIAREKDYAILFLTSQDRAERGMVALKILERHRADGLLIAPPRSGSKAILDQLKQLSVPVVAFDRPLMGRACSRILCDNFHAAELATKHLIAHGRKRILVLGGDQRLFTIQQRVEGYTRAVEKAGLEPMVEMDAGDHQTAELVISKYMAQKGGIDAIFALYSQSAINAYEVLQNRSVNVPKQVSLIGFDDFALASTLRPSITVIRQNVTEMAQAATRLLLQHMSGEISSPQAIEVSAELIVRQSCGCGEKAVK